MVPVLIATYFDITDVLGLTSVHYEYMLDDWRGRIILREILRINSRTILEKMIPAQAKFNYDSQRSSAGFSEIMGSNPPR